MTAAVSFSYAGWFIVAHPIIQITTPSTLLDHTHYLTLTNISYYRIVLPINTAPLEHMHPLLSTHLTYTHYQLTFFPPFLFFTYHHSPLGTHASTAPAQVPLPSRHLLLHLRSSLDPYRLYDPR